MKTLKLILEIEFSEKINTDEEINEVAENVRKALVHAVDTSGLSPDGSDAYTKEISITCPWNNLEILHSIDGANNKSDKIKYIKGVINKYGNTSCCELQRDHSPSMMSLAGGEVSELVEQFNANGVETVVYSGELEIAWNNYNYEELSEDIIDEIVQIMEDYEADSEKTLKRCEN